MKTIHGTLFYAAALAAFTAGFCRAETAQLPPLPGRQITPLTAAINGELIPVKLSDGKYYMMHDLLLTNTSTSPVTVTGLTLTDPLEGDSVVFSMTSEDVAAHMHFGDASDKNTTIPGRGAAVLTVDSVFAGDPPRAIDHNLSYRTANPSVLAPAGGTERIARAPISDDKPVLIGPPLKGRRWVAANVAHNHAHRNAFFGFNGRWYTPERWAVDYLRLMPDSRPRSAVDTQNLGNYPAYGQDVISVKDGTVLKVMDGLDDLAIGATLQNMTFDNLGGNIVVVDIGDGYSAFYAHFIKNTIAVKEGDRVKRGQTLGKLGNSGNSTGPHLHFHIVKGRDYLASYGVPYVITNFAVEGQPDESKDLSECFSNNTPCPVTDEFAGYHSYEMPADDTIIAFPGR